jgi:protein SCO1/2
MSGKLILEGRVDGLAGARRAARTLREAGAGAAIALDLQGFQALEDGGPQAMSTPSEQAGGAAPRSWGRPLAVVLTALLGAAIVVIIALAVGPSSQTANTQAYQLTHNPDIDPGTALYGPAPTFTLTDQFGRAVSLRSYRGKVVILAFNDAECTTVCPLTTAAMVQAKALLGPAGAGVELLGVNANPSATAVRWVRAYSQVHGMEHQWQFLTGSLPALKRVWHAYHIEARIVAGQVDHTPAVYVIDRQGRYARVYLTQMAYASVSQQAQILAHEVSQLLPGHPSVPSKLSYGEVEGIAPATPVALPRAGGGSVRVGADGSPRLYVFFASWLSETMDIGSELDSLNAYESIAAAHHLPALTAVDEGSVEPSAKALPQLLAGLGKPLSYPVAIDETGRVADGYQVQDQPWFVLASRNGTILWYWDASTQGWPTTPELIDHVTAGLAHPPHVKVPTLAQIPKVLAGSPAPLAAIHAQAGKLLGSVTALAARVHKLHGYPIVINAWASWCEACQGEYSLFAKASVLYGRQVAFLGLDTLDNGASYARSYLAGHPLSYPSYQSPEGELNGLAPPIINLPETIYIDRAGRVVTHIAGAYDSQGSLDGDIQNYALGE